MIRSFVSDSVSGIPPTFPGLFSVRNPDGSFANYPGFFEGISAPAFVVFDSEHVPSLDQVYERLHQVCSQRRMQLGLAESCTGGLIGSLLTNHSGSSKYLYGGWIVYSNHAKFTWLQVSPYDLEQSGAVSAVVVQDLLRGVMANSPCSHALAVSGIAGPEGGSIEKPVGTVFIGVASRTGPVLLKEFRFTGDRKEIRQAAAWSAAMMLMELFWLLENNVDTLPKL